jgi:hypothetical protein
VLPADLVVTDSFSITLVLHLAKAAANTIPQTYKQAMNSPDASQWEAAMQAEINLLHEQKVWELVNSRISEHFTPQEGPQGSASSLCCQTIQDFKSHRQVGNTNKILGAMRLTVADITIGQIKAKARAWGLMYCFLKRQVYNSIW